VPRKVFVAGEILTAADVNTNLMDQAVMVFDDSAARGSAIPSPIEGMVTYLKDVNQVQAYTGAAFTPVGTVLQVVSTIKTDTFGTTLILGSLAVGAPATSTASIVWRLSGGNTASYVGDAAGSRSRSIGQMKMRTDGVSPADFLPNMSIAHLDSPATTSATTYTVQIARPGSGDTAFVNRSAVDTDSSVFGRGASTLTVMEVAG
jgi:hypothetical protein